MASKDTKLQIIVDAQNRTGAAFNGVQKNLDETKRSLEGVQSTMKGIGAAGVVALGGLGLLTKNIIAAGAGFEQTQIAFETMLGSAEVAQKTLRDLATFASQTPFELSQLEEASKRLLAYGLTAEELLPTLRNLGNISAGVGMDKLPQLILAFGQVRAATKLTGTELRQFSEAGVPLLGMLADQFGKTEGEMIEMISAGEVGFPAVQQALASMSAEGGKFYNLMERQSTSLGGLWSNLKDQIALTARAIGTELLPYLTPLVEKLIEVTKIVGVWVNEHPKLAAGILAVSLGLAALMAILLPIALVLPIIIAAFTGLGLIFAFVASGPGLLIIASIAAIGFALVQLTRIGFTLKNDWEMIWLGIKVVAANAANAVIGIVEGMVNFVISGVNLIIRAVNKVISAMARVPGLGSKFKGLKIDEVSAANFGRIDTDAMAMSSLNKSAGQQTVVNISGNTFLDQDSAVLMGDMMLKKLGMSNAF